MPVAAAPGDEGEACQRCGEVGEDRRMLWMACAYAMHELGLPFQPRQLTGTVQGYLGEREIAQARVVDGYQYPGISGPQFAAVDPEAGPHAHVFYTLRVCKPCRADWMQAIADWFAAPAPAAEGAPNYTAPDGTAGYVYVRRYGALRLVTADEIAAMIDRGHAPVFVPAEPPRPGADPAGA